MKSIDFEIKIETEVADVKNLYTILRPDVKPEDIEYGKFEQGVINLIVKLDDPKSKDPLIVRAYNLKMNASRATAQDGEETFDLADFQNRKLELAALARASDEGISIKLIATFKNGFIYKFIDGDINSVELYDRVVAEKTAIKMARLHKFEFPDLASKEAANLKFIGPNAILRNLTQNFDQLQKMSKHEEFKTVIPPFTELEKENDKLHEIVLAHDAYGKTCFCHNDLNMSNLLIDKKTKDPIFIDFEWSDTNYQMYDISYHLISMAGQFLLCYKPELVPTDDFIRDWLRAYYKESNRLDGIVMPKEEFDVLIENGLKKVLVNMLSVRLIWLTRAMFFEMDPTIANQPPTIKDYCLNVYNDFLKHKDQDLKLLETLQNPNSNPRSDL